MSGGGYDENKPVETNSEESKPAETETVETEKTETSQDGDAA